MGHDSLAAQLQLQLAVADTLNYGSAKGHRGGSTEPA